MRDLARLPVADDHVGLPSDDRRDQLGNVRPAILVVAIGVDDDVRTLAQGFLDPARETAREAAIGAVLHDVVDTETPRDLDRAVGRTVVDHEDLDLVDARNAARKIDERLREGLLLVQARYLDDQFHVSGAPSREPGLGARWLPPGKFCLASTLTRVVQLETDMRAISRRAAFQTDCRREESSMSRRKSSNEARSFFAAAVAQSTSSISS